MTIGMSPLSPHISYPSNGMDKTAREDWLLRRVS